MTNAATTTTETGPCGSLVPDMGPGPDADPEAWEAWAECSAEAGPDGLLVECGARVHTCGEGWRCENGHGHAGIELEWAADGEVALAESIIGRELPDHEVARVRGLVLAGAGWTDDEEPF